jgi:hypothetical protein
MADAATTVYAMVKPEVGASADTWGGKCNQNYDDIDALLGALITTGSANAYVLTSGLSLASYVAGQRFLIKTNFANTGAATINVDGLGAKNLTKNGTTALASGDLSSGVYYFIVYDGTQFQIVGALNNTVQPLDALLTAIAALTTADDRMLDFTGSDTVAVVTYATVIANIGTLLPAGSSSAPALAFGSASSDTNTGFFQATGDVIGVAAGGSEVARFTTGGPKASLSGTASAPAWSFNAQSNLGMFRNGADNLGFAVNGALVLNLSTAGAQITGTLRARVPRSSETSGTLTAANSANAKVKCTGDVTINDGVFAADDFIVIYAGSSSRQIIQDTGMTLRLSGTATTGTRTLAAYGRAVIDFDTNADATVSGDVS